MNEKQQTAERSRRTLLKRAGMVGFLGIDGLGRSVNAAGRDGGRSAARYPDVRETRKSTRRDGRIASQEGQISLPTPRLSGDLSVEAAIANRRSRREYGDAPLSLREVGQLAWAAQGVTDVRTSHRAAPSAGALYPLELYAVVGEGGVRELVPGVYRYEPAGHELATVVARSVQADLADAALGQDSVATSAMNLVITAVDRRTTGKYGRRGERRYVPMEAGHAAENVYLQAESLGLGTVTIGAFYDGRVRELLSLAAAERPLYVLPVGRRR